MDYGFPPNLFVGTIGALFIASSFSLLFLGAVLILSYEYFNCVPKDRWIFKLVVGVCLFFTVADSVTIMGWAYEWSVKYYGAPAVMINLPAYYPLNALAVSVCTSTNQVFYAYRIQVISQAYWIPGLILFFSMYQFGFMMWLAQLLFKNPYTEALDTKVMPAGYSWMASCAMADLLISGSMVWYLTIKANNSRGDVRLSSQSLFKRIVLQTIQFNVGSLVFQITEMVLGTPSVIKGTLWFLVPSSTISKVYTAAVLISLISRGATKTENSNSIGLSDLSGSSGPRSKRTGSSGITVTVDQHREEAKSTYDSDCTTPVSVSFDRALIQEKQEQV